MNKKIFYISTIVIIFVSVLFFNVRTITAGCEGSITCCDSVDPVNTCANGSRCSGTWCPDGSACTFRGETDCGGMAIIDCNGSYGSCGASCFPGQTYSGGHCYNTCTPSCPAGYCGDDGCGGTCGCASGQSCNGNTCQDIYSCDQGCDRYESTYDACGAGSCPSTQRRIGITKRYAKNLHTGACDGGYCYNVSDHCANYCECGATTDRNGNLCCAYDKLKTPTGLTATQDSGDNHVKLTWNAVTQDIDGKDVAPNGYSVQISTDGSHWTGTGECDNVTGTSCIDTVTPRTEHRRVTDPPQNTL